MKPGMMAISEDGCVFGLEKGHKVEKRSMKARPAQRRRQSKRVKKVVEIVREVAGLAPYEKRMIEAIKTMGGSADKKLYKVAKQRLGTHRRAMQKRSEIKELFAVMRSKGQA